MADDLTAASSSTDASMADGAATDNTTAGGVSHAGHPGSDARRRRLALLGGLALVLGPLALFAVGRVWGSGRSGYLVARNLDAPLLWPTVAILGGLVLWAVRRASRGRTALDVLGWVLVPIVVLTFMRFIWFTGMNDPTRTYLSPDGSRTLVIESAASILDPEWEIRLESGGGLTRRFRIVDCVTGDWSNIERAQWLSSTTAKIVRHSGADASDEITTTLTFPTTPDGHIDMSGHGLDTCTPDIDSSPR